MGLITSASGKKKETKERTSVYVGTKLPIPDYNELCGLYGLHPQTTNGSNLFRVMIREKLLQIGYTEKEYQGVKYLVPPGGDIVDGKIVDKDGNVIE